MKISHNWLQEFFSAPLPDAQALSDALTVHAFEIESLSTYEVDRGTGDTILDVKVTPNRGHDCLSHRGIAKEISAILNIPMKADPLREPVSLAPKYTDISVHIDDGNLCRRYIVCYIRGVKVGPSPDWLKGFLEAIGQRSINNIVDAANFVMFNVGQPLHAFDCQRLALAAESRGPSTGADANPVDPNTEGRRIHNSIFNIHVRNAKKGERMLALDDKEYELSESALVIADGSTDSVIGVAGIKGGKAAEVNEATTDIIIESANFNGVSVRKTAQALKLRTDASQRFEQSISPEIAAYGMRAVTDLILKIAGGELVGFADEYPTPQTEREVSISATQADSILGTALGEKDISDVFSRLGLLFKQAGEVFTVSVPFERLDLMIPEDLVEEIARIVGYDKIPAVELPEFPNKPEVNKNFYTAEKVREDLISKGYPEVCTSVFADKGEREVLNKVGGERPYLRANLTDGLEEAVEKNARNKDLLGLKEVKLFEIGTVWNSGKEEIVVGTAGEKEKPMQTPLAKFNKEVPESARYENFPLSTAERYQPFSRYPSIVRDIALWTAADTKPEEVLEIIRKESGELLVRSELFDTFEKAGKTSYAFRLIFQSFEKTLIDAEINEIMEKVYTAVRNCGWEVR
ncbi:MAG: phenylalanine--tRNA ligase subunit beta [bacterium]|nr:phenylalanine--tRNA ligase subunit beta [bacterium]